MLLMFRPLTVAAALTPFSLADAPMLPVELPNLFKDPHAYHALGLSRKVTLTNFQATPTGDINLSGIFKYMSTWTLPNGKKVAVGTVGEGSNSLPTVILLGITKASDFGLDSTVQIGGYFDLCYIDPQLKQFLPSELSQMLKGKNFFLVTTPDLANPIVVNTQTK